MSYLFFAISTLCLSLFFALRTKRELSERILIGWVGALSFIGGYTYIEPTPHSIELQSILIVHIAVILAIILWSEIFRNVPKNWLSTLPEKETIKMQGNMLTYAFVIAFSIVPIIFLITDGLHISEYLYGVLAIIFIAISAYNLKKRQEFNEYIIALCLIIIECLMIHSNSHQEEQFRTTSRVDTDGLMFIFATILLLIRGHHENGLASGLRKIIKHLVSTKDKNKLTRE
jgi:Na+/H+ antiporter NhaD/arsenite permease-like protein